ncbi:MAG: hypothetical protein HWN67_07580 [Candidatus Helarchaeota archaeon]|nr:hypothetical protein [Candidatus Helarchaeota archaeon]
MIFCKRCGSITINGICNNCSGSNVVSHLSPNTHVGLELNFFSPTSEIEKKLKWKNQLEDRENLTTKVQDAPPEDKGMVRNVGSIASLKSEEKDDPLGLKRMDEKNNKLEDRKIIEHVENILNTHPLIKKRIDWRKKIEENTSITTDLRNFKLPPKTDVKEKPKMLKQKKDKDTEIYKID